MPTKERFIFDATRDEYRDLKTGVYLAEPPTRHYQYRVASAKGTFVETTHFPVDTVLGTGNYSGGMPVECCEFAPADSTPPNLLDIGHIAARLHAGVVIAEPIDA